MHTCDMVNIDWGVDDDDEIYQVPDITFRHPNTNLGIVRSRPVSTINPLITSPSHAALKRTKSASPESYAYIICVYEYVFVYRITEESVGDEKEQKESEENKKVPSPPQ